MIIVPLTIYICSVGACLWISPQPALLVRRTMPPMVQPLLGAYHYFGRFTHAAARCKSIFGNAGIAAALVGR
jgi:hypothetical protein